MSEATETTEEKPKTRRTRSKASTEEAVTAEAKPEKAAKKTTRKKTAAKSAGEKPAVDDGARVEDAEAKTPKAASKRKSTRAKAVREPEVSDSASEAASQDEAAAPDETTKPKRRTRSRKTVVDVGGEEAGAKKEASPSAKGEASAEGSDSVKEGTSAKSPSDGETPVGKGGESSAKEGKTEAQDAPSEENSPTESEGKSEHARRGNERRNRRKRNKNQEVTPSVTLEELAEMKVADLRVRATELNVNAAGLKKDELVVLVYSETLKAEGFRHVEGVLDVLSDGYGFLRGPSYLPGENDSYVGTNLIRRNGLRKGDYVVGTTRPMRENEKYAALQKIDTVNGVPLDQLGKRVKFSELTPIYPDERLVMEHGKNTTTARVIDLTAPIGKGQRGLIVSPPKAGKTTVLKDIAAAITANNPEVHLMCLLVDERPEEVTDMERSIHGEVVSSTFDMPCENHITVAELVIERAKRLVENGEDVVILLDSITRLARAYNLAQPASGRILSGGVDSTALYPPKRFLGAARNIEFGGSLTILASALIDTGSKMDEVIFEEFKGTGNMELKLDRQLADRRIFPAIDPVTSGTRKEDLLLDPQEAPLIWAVRRLLANMNNTERAMDMLIKSLRQTHTNQEFLIRTAKKAQASTGKIDEL